MIYVDLQQMEIIQNILGIHIAKFNVFGSRARGDCKPLSDLDLIYDNNIDDKEIARIKNLFDDSMLPFKVDIVNSAHCSEEFIAIIKADRRSVSP